jgi:hypothetical protein
LDRTALCGQWFLPLKRLSAGNVEYSVVPLRCKSWSCPVCRSYKAQSVKQRIGKLFDGRKLFMLTLTYYHNVPPLVAWSMYNKAWNRFRTAVVKEFGGFSFCRILESHKQSPYPHLHVILDKDIPLTYIGREAVSAGFGYQIDYHVITSDAAVNYVTKYLTKEWDNLESLDYVKLVRARRVSYSRDISLPVVNNDGWTCIGDPMSWEAAEDLINTDRQWDTSQMYRELYTKSFPGYYYVSFLVDEAAPGSFARADLERWCPDDWVPR